MRFLLVGSNCIRKPSKASHLHTSRIYWRQRVHSSPPFNTLTQRNTSVARGGSVSECGDFECGQEYKVLRTYTAAHVVPVACSCSAKLVAVGRVTVTVAVLAARVTLMEAGWSHSLSFISSSGRSQCTLVVSSCNTKIHRWINQWLNQQCISLKLAS